MVSTEKLFGRICVMNHEAGSQSRSEDDMTKHESLIGELKLHIPTMFFCSATANEINEYLIEKFY